MTNPKRVIIFPNGNVAIFDENGQQIPEIQGSWINFDYLRKLGKLIAENEPTLKVEPLGTANLMLADILGSYVKYYNECPQCKHMKSMHQAREGGCTQEIQVGETGAREECDCGLIFDADPPQQEIRTELLTIACDGVWSLIDAHSRFMNAAELDEFTEKIHSRLYEVARERLKRHNE